MYYNDNIFEENVMQSYKAAHKVISTLDKDIQRLRLRSNNMANKKGISLIENIDEENEFFDEEKIRENIIAMNIISLNKSRVQATSNEPSLIHVMDYEEIERLKV